MNSFFFAYHIMQDHFVVSPKECSAFLAEEASTELEWALRHISPQGAITNSLWEEFNILTPWHFCEAI